MQRLNDCLACGGSALVPYLDLGAQPLANSFHDGTRDLPRFPLEVQVCRHCWHSQLTVAVDPHLMFDDYLYVSGTSETLRRYFAEFAARFPRGTKVLDLACNDGSLLDAFEARGAATWGVDPSYNQVMKAGHKGHAVWCSYWDRRGFECVTGAAGRFDLITAFNVLGHTADPLTFLELARDALAPGGSIWVQTSQANMVLDGTFDAIYHEHVSYFTPRSIAALARRAGLNVARIELAPVHGGSMLVELTRDAGVTVEAVGPLYQEDTYRKFAAGVRGTVGQVSCIGLARPVVGYGAAAKGMTFLNATGLRLDRIVDDNPAKQGLLTPGGNVPVGPVADLPRGEGMIVVLAWNFWDEILGRIRRDQGSGHNLMRFLPGLRIVMS